MIKSHSSYLVLLRDLDLTNGSTIVEPIVEEASFLRFQARMAARTRFGFFHFPPVRKSGPLTPGIPCSLKGYWMSLDPRSVDGTYFDFDFQGHYDPWPGSSKSPANDVPNYVDDVLRFIRMGVN